MKESKLVKILHKCNIGFNVNDIQKYALDELHCKRSENQFDGNFYQSIFLTLTHKLLDEHDAKILWRKVVKHRRTLSAALNREVLISVAVHDYLSTQEPKLVSPVIIEEEESKDIIEDALHDKLTGLFSRGIFDVFLQRELNACIRNKDDLCLLIIDVDDFKQINDTYGHITGDNVLKMIAGAIIKSVRCVDISARFGGEEFAVIMPQATVMQAKAVAERIRKRIQKVNIENIDVKVSIGVSCVDFFTQSADELLLNADEALYQAKRRGKDQIEICHVDFNRGAE